MNYAESINIAAFGLMGLLGAFSVWTSYKLYKSKDLKTVNTHTYRAVPSIFVTIGVLGTFAGIYIGLNDFEVVDIENSIEELLEGLKSSFSTSLGGITLSIIFGRVHDFMYARAESETVYESSELSSLNELNATLKMIKEQLKLQSTSIDKTIKSFVKDNKTHQSIQLEISKEFSNAVSSQHLELIDSIEGLTARVLSESKQIELQEANTKLNKEQHDETIAEFKNFGSILAENNSQALVDVMQSATNSFNEQMNAIVERLVKENFQELNASVSNMVKWQAENKEMIETLSAEFKKVQENFSISSEQLTNVSKNTNALVSDEGKLVVLITQLKEVLVDNNKFAEITTSLGDTVEQLKATTGKLDDSVESYDEATGKLQLWIGAEKSFKEQVAIILTQLEEYKKIKGYNEEYWSETKQMMGESIGIIKDASVHLREDIKSINEVFLNELNDLLNSLDELVTQRLQ